MSEIGSKNTLTSGLYIVASPIGNLADISKRALDVLKAADVIACEDTRVTAKLLTAYLIKKPLIAYHEHSNERQRSQIAEQIKAGKIIALVSDAGTPLISDPGYKLVRDIQEEGLAVYGIPGPCAATTALSIAGLPSDRFLFLGFAPNKSKARQDWFAAEATTQATLVLYESARRLAASLEDANKALGDREVAVCRELTKKFEEVRRDTLSGLAAHYAEVGNPKGEVVVIIAPPDKTGDTGHGIDSTQALKLALEHMSVKSAARFVADLTGANKKQLYSLALDLTGKKSDA